VGYFGERDVSIALSPIDLEASRIRHNPFNVQTGGDHYAKLAIQPMQYALANGIPYAEGLVIKYVTRWRDKGGVEDLKKARHVLDMLIAHEEAGQ
jgi:hypothetical protein